MTAGQKNAITSVEAITRVINNNSDYFNKLNADDKMQISLGIVNMGRIIDKKRKLTIFTQEFKEKHLTLFPSGEKELNQAQVEEMRKFKKELTEILEFITAKILVTESYFHVLPLELWETISDQIKARLVFYFKKMMPGPRHPPDTVINKILSISNDTGDVPWYMTKNEAETFYNCLKKLETYIENLKIEARQRKAKEAQAKQQEEAEIQKEITKLQEQARKAEAQLKKAEQEEARLAKEEQDRLKEQEQARREEQTRLEEQAILEESIKKKAEGIIEVEDFLTEDFLRENFTRAEIDKIKNDLNPIEEFNINDLINYPDPN